jgi:hypothetical protein
MPVQTYIILLLSLIPDVKFSSYIQYFSDLLEVSLYVRRDAERPTSGVDIEARLPGGRDIGSQLHVKPRTTSG